MTATPDHEPVPSRIDESLPLVDRLQAECDSTGSAANYIYSLGIYYKALDEHRANMLQLERAARFIIDHRGHETDGSLNTDAFYWGEILGYTVCDRLIGEWPTVSWQLMHEDYKTSLDALSDSLADDVSSYEDVATNIIGQLEELETAPPQLDNLIADWAEQVTDSPYLQQNIILGFRYIIRNVIKDATSDTSMANECQSIFELNDIQIHPNPEIVPIDDVRQAIMMSFADHYIDIGIKGDEEDDAYFLNLEEMSTRLNIDMKKNQRLRLGDAVRIHGDVLLVTMDNDSEMESSARLVDGGNSVEGEAGYVYVFQGPTESIIPRLKAISKGESVDDSTAEISQLYAVHMELINPVMITPDGNSVPFSKDETVYLVMSNNRIHINRYVL